MLLSNGVRPWHEDMPRKGGGEHVELYTSNTTASILSMLNKVTAEKEVAREDLENSMMRNRVITAFGRKQLLNAVYGKEPDPSNRHDRRTGFTGKLADKDKFFRHHLGTKLVRGWVGGNKLKRGSGIHYENEGNNQAYLYADRDEENDNGMLVPGQVGDQCDKDTKKVSKKKYPLIPLSNGWLFQIARIVFGSGAQVLSRLASAMQGLIT